MSRWTSHAKWPHPEVKLGNTENVSTDEHGSEGEARAICHRLHDRGFGADRKVWPIRTWVTGKLWHKNHGEVVVNEDTQHLDRANPDPTSRFVQHDGDIIEVSKNMVTGTEPEAAGL